MAGKFEVYKDKSGAFRWKLTHTNGRVNANSGGGYATKVNVIRGLWGASAVINSR